MRKAAPSHENRIPLVRVSVRTSPSTRAIARRSTFAGSSSGETSYEPSAVPKSLSLAGPRPTLISGRCGSRAEKWFMIVNASGRLSSAVTHASSSS